MRIAQFPHTIRVIFALLVIFAFGCSNGNARRALPTNSSEQNLRLLGVAYHQTQTKKGRPPSGVDELKPTLQRLQYTEGILVSPNDGQPFTICWGVEALQSGESEGSPVLAYETNGAGGKKYVLNSMLSVQQMTQAELEQALLVK